MEKPSKRNNEKRRERSKVAARCRRGKESEIFSDLASCLPLPKKLRTTLDKASVARLAVTYLKMKGMVTEAFGCIPPDLLGQGQELEFGSLLNESMGGFAFVLSADGDIVFISESVTKCLGLSQCDVMGQSVFNFVHPCDHLDIRDLVAMSRTAPKDQPIQRSGFFRMKCTITSKGRNVHLRAASYKGVSCVGRLYRGQKDTSERWYVGFGETLFDPTDVGIPLNKQAFVTRHSMDMLCEEAGGNVNDFMGYKTEDLVGKSFYDFFHGADGVAMASSMKALYSKGQIQTERYRFLAKGGGWVWVVTQATVLKPENGSKATGIVCLHFITSGIEHEHEIMSPIQIELTPLPVSTDEASLRLPEVLAETAVRKPTPSTTKIFARRTEDMDSGFLMPCDNMLIVSKEEPEDLTHLAPIPGDECVPLNVPLLDDLLRSFDQGNLEYSMNGFFVNVEMDSLPIYNYEDQLSLSKDLAENSLLVEGSSESPLFLNSDPNMGVASNSSFQTSFPLLQSPTFQQDAPRRGAESTELLREDEEFCYTGLDNLVTWDEAFILPDSGNQKLVPPLPEEMTEFRAPFIPTDEQEIVPLLSSSNTEPFLCPNQPTIDGPGKMSSRLENIVGKADPFLPQVTQSSKSKSLSKFSEQNIDQITWTLDIGSILAARKPGDQPKVVTHSIFAAIDTPPPPTKVRKMAAVRSEAQRESSSNTHKPPSLNSDLIRNVKEERVQKRILCAVSGALDMELMRYDCHGKMSRPPDGFFPNNSLRKRNISGSFLRIPNFHDLTQQDYEKMVPLLEQSLLQGSELFQALDSVSEISN